MKSNPLATRFVTPGHIQWLAQSDEQRLDRLATHLQHLRYRAAIVGPHGSGKSTLLEHLVPLLGTVLVKHATYSSLPLQPLETPPLFPSAAPPESCGSESEVSTAPQTVDQLGIIWLQMRGQWASARLLHRTMQHWAHRNRMLIIDGYEQLAYPARGLAIVVTRLTGAGLLLTSHRRTWLPTLVETQGSVALAQQLLEQLLPLDLPDRAGLLDPKRLSPLLSKHNGNLRELFMDLYDTLETACETNSLQRKPR
ncbi:MAG: hypothetical protein IT423_13425 [Pirellulaceae bacterium]|nr:hypothetical protein [Pirellulaceae bacterium]